MNFASDTTAPAHPKVIDAIAAVNSGTASSYGADEPTAQLRNALSDLFETEAFDFWVCASGTASNALALSVMCSSIGAIACHEEAHIERDERGAPEFLPVALSSGSCQVMARKLTRWPCAPLWPRMIQVLFTKRLWKPSR